MSLLLCFAGAPGPVARAQGQPPRGPSEVEAALERWDDAGLAALARDEGDAALRALAGGAGDFLAGRYREAEERLSGLAREPAATPEARGVGQHLLEKAGAWRLVTGTLHRELLVEGVELLAPPAEAPLLRPFVQEVLDATKQAFPDAWDGVARPGLRVVILPREEAFSMVSDLQDADVLGAGVRGVMLYRTVFVLSPSAVHSGYDWQRVLAHELLHALIRTTARGPLPVWFDEGMAWTLDSVWRTGKPRSPGAVDRGLLAAAARGRSLHSWTVLESSFGRTGSPREARLAFVQAGVAFRVILDAAGPDAGWNLCRSAGEGRDFDTVLKEITGQPPQRLRRRAESAWSTPGSRADLSAARIRFDLESDPDGIAAQDRMSLADLVWGRGHPAEALRILQGIGDEELRAMPSWALRAGRLLLELGRPEEAAAVVAPALEMAEDDSQLVLARALAYERVGDRDGARGLLEQALRLQPFAADLRVRLLKLGGGLDDRER
ncbi:MAG: tetratricopeptide repeat protein [Deltaproteobacteria bacterium]|nr:tetratricopeptide repeat protein [Deltaproteobacteria bacterium]